MDHLALEHFATEILARSIALNFLPKIGNGNILSLFSRETARMIQRGCSDGRPLTHLSTDGVSSVPCVFVIMLHQCIYIVCDIFAH